MGEKLGHYEVLSLLGRGGMGEVYRASDATLERDVALKVLPAAFLLDSEPMARFQREAEVLASLDHPNIGPIYGLVDSAESRTLVLALIEGPTLADQIAVGPLPHDEAIAIAKQIIEALEYAHDRGVIHRDLKPANVKITPDGVVKVLDFGLAKVLEDETPKSSLGNSPTLTLAHTRAGVILGTATYMSPEQAVGRPVDQRSDIFSFGAVLYEMLTGARAFAGTTTPDVLEAVVKNEPDWSALPTGTPAYIRKLLARMLQKDRKQRLQAIGEARIILANPDENPKSQAPARVTPSKLAWVAAATLAVSLAGGVSWMTWRTTQPTDRPLMRLSVDLGPDAVTGADITVAISPDGTRLVFPIRGKEGKQQLATRLLDQTAATVLPGTEGANDPFFSPDGQWVGFFADNKMKKISLLGGAPITLCDAYRGWGASWGEDGNTIAALSTISAGLSRISTAGGTPQKVTALVGVRTIERWPQILPGGEAVVFTASNSLSTFQNATIEAVSLRTGQKKTLVRDAYFGRYFSDGWSGYLVYVHDNVLFAAPFDAQKLDLRGMPTPLVEDLAGDQASGADQFDFSRTGTFVYRSGKAPDQEWTVQWLDSSGKTSPLLGMPATYTTPRSSPDGLRLALTVGRGNGQGIFVYDWRRDFRLPLTSSAQGNSSLYPVWTPDGKHIAYRSTPSSGGSSIEWLRSDDSGVGQRLFESKNLVQPYSFSPDGRLLAYFEASPGTATNIGTIPLDLTDPDRPKVGRPEVFLSSPAVTLHPVFSPYGRRIAYASNKSGGFEIYVRSLSASGGEWQISSNGGMHPMWSQTARELFYTNPDNRILVADYVVEGESFKPGKSRVWSNTQIRDQGGITNLDLTPDGKRFAIVPTPEAPAPGGSVHMTFLLNFFDEVRRRVPVQR